MVSSQIRWFFFFTLRVSSSRAHQQSPEGTAQSSQALLGNIISSFPAVTGWWETHRERETSFYRLILKTPRNETTVWMPYIKINKTKPPGNDSVPLTIAEVRLWQRETPASGRDVLLHPVFNVTERIHRISWVFFLHFHTFSSFFAHHIYLCLHANSASNSFTRLQIRPLASVF